MVFHKYDLIFIGIPKNASTSIYELLKNRTDRDHHHNSIMTEYSEHDVDLMESYSSFCIVRNPYDRFISACYQIRRDEPELNGNLTLDEIVEQEWIQKDEWEFNEAFIPQHRFVCFGSKLLVDKVLSYESLEKDWEEFTTEYNNTSKLKISPILPTANNSEDRKTWQQEIKQLSTENFNLVNQKYAKDFELFGYEMIKK